MNRLDRPFIVSIPTEITSLVPKRKQIQKREQPLPRIRLIDVFRERRFPDLCITLISSFLGKRNVIPMALSRDDQFLRLQQIAESVRMKRQSYMNNAGKDMIPLAEKLFVIEEERGLEKDDIPEENYADYQEKFLEYMKESKSKAWSEIVDQDLYIQNRIISKHDFCFLKLIPKTLPFFKEETTTRWSLGCEQLKAFRSLEKLCEIHKKLMGIQQGLRESVLLADVLEGCSEEEAHDDQIAKCLFTMLDSKLSALPALRKYLNTDGMRDCVQTFTQQTFAPVMIQKVIDALFLYIKIREGRPVILEEGNIKNLVKELVANKFFAFAACISNPTQTQSPLAFDEQSLETYCKVLFGYAQQYKNDPEPLRFLFAMMNETGRRAIAMQPPWSRCHSEILRLVDNCTLNIMRSLKKEVQKQPNAVYAKEAAPLLERTGKLSFFLRANHYFEGGRMTMCMLSLVALAMTLLLVIPMIWVFPQGVCPKTGCPNTTFSLLLVMAIAALSTIPTTYIYYTRTIRSLLTQW